MITLITPTRDRPEAFALCEKYMARQTYDGPKRWIVVDDGDVPIKTTLGQTHVRRNPSGSSNTLAPNLLEAVKHIDPASESILFIEDDDWYSSNYIESLVGHLKGHEIVGLGFHRYYNVYTRRWKLFNNYLHAGLCVTAIQMFILDWLVQACNGAVASNDPWVDIRLWSADPRYPQRNLKRSILPNNGLSVGIKRMPGRSGLGSGHGVNDPADFLTQNDLSGELLRVWIGEEDAREYLQYGMPGLPREHPPQPTIRYTVSVVFQNYLSSLQACIQAIYAYAQPHAACTEIIVTDNSGQETASFFLINMETPIRGLPAWRNIKNASALSTEECHKNARGMARGEKFLAVKDDLVVTPDTFKGFFV